RTVLVVPDLCHADLFADNRFRRHNSLFLLVEEATSASHADAPPGQNPSGALVRLGRGVSVRRTPADIDLQDSGVYPSCRPVRPSGQSIGPSGYSPPVIDFGPPP